MSYLYPAQDALRTSFASRSPLGVRRNGMSARGTPYQGRPELYGAWSVVDDAKGKAEKLSAEATREFEKASAAAQAKAGKIELHSGKYYAACTFGGLIACVSFCSCMLESRELTHVVGFHSCGSDFHGQHK